MLRMIDGTGLTFMADVHRNQYIRDVDPTTDKNAKPMRVDAWADKHGPHAWKRVLMRQGTRGAMHVEVLQGRTAGRGDTVLTPADVQMLLVHFLPKRNRTSDDIMELLRRRFKRRGETLIFDPPEK